MRVLKFFQIVLLTLALISLPIITQALTYYTAQESIALTWDDDQTNIEYYEVILIRDITLVQYGPYITTIKTITINRPKSGKFEVRVRGCRDNQCSVWHSSLDDNAVLTDGTKGKWKIFFKPGAPSKPPVISGGNKNGIYQTKKYDMGSFNRWGCCIVCSKMGDSTSNN